MGDQGPEVHGGGGGGWAASSTGLPSRGHPRPPDDFANVKNIPHVSNPCPQRPPSAPGNAAESAQASPLHGPAQEDLALGLKARTQPRAGRLKGWGGDPRALSGGGGGGAGDHSFGPWTALPECPLLQPQASIQEDKRGPLWTRVQAQRPTACFPRLSGLRWPCREAFTFCPEQDFPAFAHCPSGHSDPVFMNANIQIGIISTLMNFCSRTYFQSNCN